MKRPASPAEIDTTEAKIARVEEPESKTPVLDQVIPRDDLGTSKRVFPALRRIFHTVDRRLDTLSRFFFPEDHPEAVDVMLFLIYACGYTIASDDSGGFSIHVDSDLCEKAKGLFVGLKPYTPDLERFSRKEKDDLIEEFSAYLESVESSDDESSDSEESEEESVAELETQVAVAE